MKKKSILIVVLLILLIAVLVACRYLYWIYGPNIKVKSDDSFLYIRTGGTFQEVTDSLEKKGWLLNERSFAWVAEKKNYSHRVKAGRYILSDGMSNNTLVNRLRSGEQSPVKLIFNNIRTKQQLAGRISHQIESDSVALLKMLSDKDFLHDLGFTGDNILCLFIPNTYELYWNTDAKGFLARMRQEYDRFWDKSRSARLAQTGLTRTEASILASIIEMETARNEEKPMVAGVYLNRLRKGIKLEADPTLVFALGDFRIQRILNKDLNLDSPYNTYKYAGLPPGPITLPSVASIEAVLAPAHHEYLFFCAKADLSGYHHFSKSLDQHMRYAREYQSALNKLNIKR